LWQAGAVWLCSFSQPELRHAACECLNCGMCPCLQRFVEDCDEYFTTLKSMGTWDGSGYSNGAEALAGVLELVRKNEVRRADNGAEGFLFFALACRVMAGQGSGFRVACRPLAGNRLRFGTVHRRSPFQWQHLFDWCLKTVDRRSVQGPQTVDMRSVRGAQHGVTALQRTTGLRPQQVAPVCTDAWS
jgi:hypothetical protein